LETDILQCISFQECLAFRAYAACVRLLMGLHNRDLHSRSESARVSSGGQLQHACRGRLGKTFPVYLAGNASLPNESIEPLVRH
jgi:hypothetical protein